MPDPSYRYVDRPQGRDRVPMHFDDEPPTLTLATLQAQVDHLFTAIADLRAEQRCTRIVTELDLVTGEAAYRAMRGLR